MVKWYFGFHRWKIYSLPLTFTGESTMVNTKLGFTIDGEI
jgi:hypothetical protein